MAKRLNYTIGVTADTSKLEASLLSALTSLLNLGTKSLMVPTLLQASATALDLAKNLLSAINVNTGKLDLSVFNRNLETSGLSLKSYYNQLSLLGSTGTDAFLKVAQSITTAELPLRRTNTLMNELWTTMKNTMRWQLTSSALHGFVGSIETAYGYAKDLNRSLNDIRIVSDKSADDMARFAELANKAAKALSTTTTDYTDASLIYYQQGLSDQEVLDRTETTIKMANVAGTTAETASQQLTAVWNNFYDGSKSLEYYADVMVKLGAATASSSDEISEGIEKFAAVANTVGLSYDYAATALATVTAQTRESASVVGTAFRTLFSRIQGLQQGETLDDGTTLNKYSEALAKVGVDIKDTNGDLKDMDEILNELGDRWDTLAQDQKIALAETVAGVRQWTQLIALMDNWDFFEENLALAQSSEGTLEEQAAIYAESWEAARDRTKAAAEDIYDSIINPDFFIGVDNVITPILSGTADVIDAMGGLKGMLPAIVLLMNKAFGDKITLSLRDTATQIGFLTNQEQLRARALLELASVLAKSISIEEMGVEGPAREALNITLQQVELLGLVNSKIDGLNERQKLVLQQDLNHLKSLQEQSAEYAKLIELSDELALKYKNMLKENINVDKKGEISSVVGGIKGRASQQSDTTVKNAADSVLKLVSNSKTATLAISRMVLRLEDVSKKLVGLLAVSNRIKKLSNESGELTDELRQVAYEMGGLDKSASDEEILKYFAEVDNSLEDLNAQSRVLRESLENFLPEDLVNLVIRFTAAIKLGKSATEALTYATLEYEKTNKNVTDGLNNNAYATKDWADKIVTAGNVLSQLAMSILAVKSLGNVFEDSDMTAGERLITIFTSLGMLLPTIITLTKTMAGVTLLVTISETKEVTVKGLGITATLAKAAADKILAKALGEVATATAMANAEIVASLIALAPYIALIAALGVAIYAGVKAYNADADAAKEAAAGVEVLSKSYDEARNAATELKDTINNWDSAVLSIADLTEDTKEYADAIKTANDKAKELIESQGLFDRSKWYYDDKGIIQFADGVLEELQSQADSRERLAESSLYAGLIYSNNASIKSETTNLGRSFAASGIDVQYDVDGERYYRNLTNSEIQNAVKLLKETLDTEPISNTELVDRFNELVPGLNLSVESLDDFRTELETLSKSMDKASEANDYYSKEILKNDLESNREEQLKDIAGDNEDLYNGILDTYAAREARALEEKDLALSDVTVDKSNYSSNNKLGKFIGLDIDGDEGLARLYASMFLGRTDVDQLNYKGGWNKGLLQTSSGENLFDEALSDDYMRKMIAQTYAQLLLIDSLGEGLDNFNQEAYEASLKKLVDGANSLGVAFGEADFATIILNQLAQGTESIDLSSLFAQLSPDDIAQLTGMSQEELYAALGLNKEDLVTLGITDAEAWYNSFITSLKNYDSTAYWQALSESSKKNAEDIGGILTSYLNDEDLSDEQIAILNKLGESYSNLNKLREEGGHEYFQTLREIQEQEEENNITALRNLQQEQLKKADALLQEIDGLKTVQESVTSTEAKDRLQVLIDAKTEEFDKVIDDILDTNYQIDIAVNADLKSDVDLAFGLASELEKIQGYLSDGLEISFDRAQEIIEAGYGAMLTNAQETADNTIKLNRDVVNGFIDGKQSEIEADRLSKIAQLESERALLVTKLQSLLAGIDALNTGLDATDNTAKAEALIQASKYKAQADAAQITAEQEADAADQSNDEIATDAENLVNALGIMHDTNAENSQQAYKDAETAANDSARSQINALNLILRAAVAYSNAVRDAANGTATYNPVTFSGFSNVSVGATGSKNADNTYETTEANIDISTEDILEAANNNSEVLDQALEKAKAELEAQKASVDAQIGAVDAGIAALKSALLSLDNEQSNLGKNKSSGGSSKTYDKEDLKTLKDVEDRYHDINREIQRQDDLLDDLSNATDRAWGTDALNGYENEIKALEKQQELYNQKLKEAQDYLIQDSALVKQYFADAQIGANGEITNYEDLLRENLNLYNAAVERYNLAVSGKELSEEEHTALKNQLDIEKQLFEQRLKALEQYENTLDVIRDTTDNILESARSIADKKLEEIKFKMEIVLDVKSMKDTVRDLSKEIAEMFGDALTHGLESAKLSAESAQAEAALLPSYQEEWNSLRELYESTTDDAARQTIMDEIQNLQGNIADSAKAIAEWANSIEDIVPDVVNAASERFAAFTDQLEHNTSVLDTIKELYTLQGVTYKTAEGFNRLQKNSQEKLNAQLASAKLQRGWYEQAAQRLEEAQAKLDSLGGDEHDIRYDVYKKARDAYLEEFNEAQEAYLSSAQSAMETAQDMYLQQIERAVYEFGQVVSNGVGLDLLQDKYDHYIESEERYFDKVNEAYLVASWYNKLLQDIDDTTNVAYKNRLKALQEEIDMRKEGNKLSQYDLDILNAKYQLLLALQALEDAQNAKNQILLVRDSQGNWNYQYTANQDDITKAEQDVLDALNNWYNIAKDLTKEVAGEIVSMWLECTDAIELLYKDLANGDISEEEYLKKKEEIEQYYTEKAKYLEEEKTQAIKDMNEAGYEELKNIAEKNGETVEEFENVYAKELESMTDSNKNFADMLDKYLQQCDNKFNSYKDTVNNVAQETGATFDDLAEETDKVSDATEILAEKGLAAKDSLWEMVDATQVLADEQLILAQNLMATIEQYKDLITTIAQYEGIGSGSGGSEKGYDPNTDYSGVIMDGIANGWLKYGSDEYKELIAQRESKIDNMELKEDYYGTRGDAADERYKNSSSVGQYDDIEAWKKKMHDLGVPGYATGGYTGIFDDEKLAFLHQKELVLNQTDTENILAAVRTVRDFGSDFFSSIEKALDSNAIAAMALMGQKLNPIVTTPVQDSIEQTVHIDKVEFPNVTSRTEIEEAFVSLTNDAAQWARRKS